MTESAKKKPKIEDETAEVDLEKCMQLAQRLARECGQLVKDVFASHVRSAVEYKGTIDLVTETDKEVEKRIFDGIKHSFPSHKLIGEETVSAGGTETLTDAPTWIVDPIDGTTNFVHGVPWCAISIGLSVRKLLVLGVVYNPALDELYSASIGLGAQLNGKSISVSKTVKLQNSLVATGFSYDRREHIIEFHMANLRKIILKSRDVRRFGSAALDMCAVACGRLDSYYELGIHIWDIAAATVIVREAGGVACDPYKNDQTQLDVSGRAILVAAPGIVVEILGVLAHPSPPACENK